MGLQLSAGRFGDVAIILFLTKSKLTRGFAGHLQGNILVSFLGEVAERGARQQHFLQLEQTN